ncbi:hypothetical protein BJ138DRAFT_1106113 [Hygrophoropsis aurantiaca]|uniref:Uncharacterized protein n=1 Tax=Hygrophoropsis aurantiaca TaxID=72124 RepID=A0ACB7ZX27_9AGAM|nr:hypothetical protein BJ138DRAFT_1106113 [Hygrophoropsis aurantiaca]
MNIHLSFLNLSTIYFTFITLTLPLHAKCVPFNINYNTSYTWELHVFGAKGCAKNLGYLISGGRRAGDNCMAFKNITPTKLNNVQLLNYANAREIPIRLYDNIHCSGKPFDHFPKSPYGDGSWQVDDINKDGFKRLLAFRLRS